jgi:hypothetical protein
MSKTIHPTTLAAKVAAVNRANAEANRLQPLFVEAFRPFLGSKVLKIDGLVKKAEPILERLAPFVPDGYATPSVHRNRSLYSLSFDVKVCESSPGRSADYQIANNHETSFTVGELNGCDLLKLSTDYVPQRTDYTVAEIIAKRERVAELEGQFNAAKSALYPFERYDR